MDFYDYVVLSTSNSLETLFGRILFEYRANARTYVQ